MIMGRRNLKAKALIVMELYYIQSDNFSNWLSLMHVLPDVVPFKALRSSAAIILKNL